MNNATKQKLDDIAPEIFEHLILQYLSDIHPELRGVVAVGIGTTGKAVPCPVDGIAYVPGQNPTWIYIASTTIDRRKLSSKWLGTKTKKGDIDKAGEEWQQCKSESQSTHGRLFLATNRMLDGDLRTFRRAIARAESFGLAPEIIEASVLLRYLDSNRNGHRARQEFLDIPADLISLPLLAEAGKVSLDLHINRLGPPQHLRHGIIRREAQNVVEAILAGRPTIVALDGPSGVGKSVLADQIGHSFAKNGNVALWIPAEHVVLDSPISATLSRVLTHLYPHLNPICGPDLIDLLQETRKKLLLIVDDINRTEHPKRIVGTVEGWLGNPSSSGASSSRNFDADISVIMPMWPHAGDKFRLNSSVGSTADRWQRVFVGCYTSEERQAVEALHHLFQNISLRKAIDALDGDPFMCGLISHSPDTLMSMHRHELVRSILDDFASYVAEATAERACMLGQTATAAEAMKSINELVRCMLFENEPSPDWITVREQVERHDSDLIFRCAQTNQLGWLENVGSDTRWRWKHVRLRDAFAGRCLATFLDKETTKDTVSESVKKLLDDPGLAEAWAMSLVFFGDVEIRTRAIETIGTRSPLALAHALRLGLFPQGQAERDAIERGLTSALKIARVEDREYVPSLQSLLIEQLARTDDPLVISLTEDLPRYPDVRFARIRNGDVQTALSTIRTDRDFPPTATNRYLEESVAAFGDYYADQRQALMTAFSKSAMTRHRADSIIVLMGYLGWQDFSSYICHSWQGVELNADTDTWLCHLWALSRCCDAEGKAILSNLLMRVALLDDTIRTHGSTERYRLFGEYMSPGMAMRWPITDLAAQAWADAALADERIALDLFCSCKHLESPILVEAYVRWAAVAKPFMSGDFTRDWDALKTPQPLPKDWLPRSPVYQTCAVLDRLWWLVRHETDDSIRSLAFELWKRSASHADLDKLQSVPETDPLFDGVLEVRVRLADTTAAPVLISRLKSNPGHWCSFAPILYHEPGVSEAFLDSYGRALADGRYAEFAPKHLPVSAIPDLIDRYRPLLLSKKRVWMSLLSTGVPEALALVQEAILKAPISDLRLTFFSHLDFPLSIAMLEALRPTLYRFDVHDLGYLGEHAIDSGQSQWVREHLPHAQIETGMSPNWLTVVEIHANLDELARRVPDGHMSVVRTNQYFSTMRPDSRRHILDDPRAALRSWLGTNATTSQITIAAMALAEQGTANDLEWWSSINVSDENEAWMAAGRQLKIRKWQS